MASQVVSRTLAVTATAEQVFHGLYAAESVVVWTDSRGDRGSGQSVIASGVVREIHGSPWEQLRGQWAGARCPDTQGAPLGVMVVLPYDTLQYSMGIDLSDRGYPLEPVRTIDITRSVEVDEDSGQVTAWAINGPGVAEWMESLERVLAGRVDIPEVSRAAPGEAVWRDSSEDYRGLIAQAREAIRQGEVYQLCLTTSASVKPTVSDWELHRSLRGDNPTHHQALIRLGDVSMVSASPETFLTLDRQRQAVTRPIKGTRPRGSTEREDRALIDQLVHSEKERAENLMIVDLMRNDFLRVCETGSVSVDGLFEVETYPSVHQLVSTVSGELRPECDGVDLIKACFPAGSMTGAPKHRAVTLLIEMERSPRGLYSGAWGWLRADGTIDLAMTIRTAIFQGDTASLGVGGGITWSSDPAEEIAEVGHKAQKLMGVLGVSSIQYS